jgi:hypothetical protein
MHRKGFSGRYFLTRNDFNFSAPVSSFLRAGSFGSAKDKVDDGGGAMGGATGGYMDDDDDDEIEAAAAAPGGIGGGGGTTGIVGIAGGRPCGTVGAP